METGNQITVVPDRFTWQANIYHEHTGRQPVHCSTNFSRYVPPEAMQRIEIPLGEAWVPVPVPCGVGGRHDWWEDYHLTVYLQTTDKGPAELRVGEDGEPLYAHGSGGAVFVTVDARTQVQVRAYAESTSVAVLVCACRVD